jgi:hypothetical protein
VSSLQGIERFYAIVASALFFASGAIYLCYGHWTITHQDFWRIYAFCLNHSWLTSAVSKYNGHSLFWPSQILLADLRFFHGDQRVLFWIGLSLQLTSIGLLVSTVLRKGAAPVSQKVFAILMLVLANTWMARASMTASGGFNCCYSLTLSGVAFALFWLGELAKLANKHRGLFMVILGGYLATFSFGTGLMIWPTILYLAYCLRLRSRVYIRLGLAATLALILFAALPGREGNPSLGFLWREPFPDSLFTLLFYFCRLLGSPFFHAMGAWLPGDVETHLQIEPVTLLCGIIGSLLAFVALVAGALRRHPRTGISITALGLICFTFLAFAFIAVARAEHIRAIPAELNAPRYLFWSSLFWAGLALLLIDQQSRSAPARIAATIVALAAPIFLIPSQYREGMRWRFIQQLSDSAAMAFANGVRDETKMAVLFPSLDQIYKLAPQLKRQRMDMFAQGLQDWIGRRPASFYPGCDFKGACRVADYLHGEDGRQAVRLGGWVVCGRRAARTQLAVVDAAGTIQGIGTTFANDDWLTRLLYAGKLGHGSLIAYIPHFDEKAQYSLHEFQSGKISAAQIPINTAPAR